MPRIVSLLVQFKERHKDRKSQVKECFLKHTAGAHDNLFPSKGTVHMYFPEDSYEAMGSEKVFIVS